MSKVEILWENFVNADKDFKAGLIPLHDRQKAFNLFKEQFVLGAQ
jgi:hypothetical protein